MKKINNINRAKIAHVFAIALLVTILIPIDAHASGGSSWTSFFTGMMASVSSAINSVLGAAAGALSTFLGTIGSTLNALGLGPLWNVLMGWMFGAGTCGQTVTASGQGVGTVICNVVWASDMLPGLIAGIAYLIGIACAISALIKLKDHVLNPNGTPLSDSMKRFVAGGAFLALPIVTAAAKSAIYGSDASNQLATLNYTQFTATTSGGYGLDTMLVALVADILTPLTMLFRGFCYLAGLIFIVIGISRVMKTAQEGPRGPAGVGTVMTFLTAGVFFSLDAVLGSFATSLFGTNVVTTYPVLDQSTGDTAVNDHIQAVITAVTAFVFIIGWVSFIRGFFIIRNVAEGTGQASMMAGLTHVFGGAIAVNLGPMMNAVQATLGLDGFGVTFN